MIFTSIKKNVAAVFTGDRVSSRDLVTLVYGVLCECGYVWGSQEY